MTEPRATGPATFKLPDQARMRAEIGADRRHERFLVRAALVAAVLVAVMITSRMIWL